MKGNLSIGKKIVTWKPSVRVLAVSAVVLLALLLVPLARISLYAVPWYDDYNFGRFARSGIEALHSPWGALKGAWDCARTQWYAWQGTYSSVFFMALVPVIWGEEYYFLGPLFIMLLLFAGVFTLVGVLARKLLQADRASCLILQSVITASVFLFIHSAQSGFFWYNGGIHYVGMHGMSMLFIVTAVCLLQNRQRGKVILLFCLGILLALLTAGSNFVTTLQGLLVLLTIMALGFYFYGRRAFVLVPILCAYALGFYQNVAAPGNAVRAQSYVGWGYAPVEAVLRSFLEAFRHMSEFTGLIVPTVLLLLVPVIWQVTGRTSLTFRFPGIVTLWSFCLYATGFTPSLYSLGHAGISRTLNAVKITYLLLLFLNEVYWLGWLRQKLTEKGRQIWDGRAVWWFYPLVGACMLGIFMVSPNQAGHYSSYGAYYYVHTGEAYNFRQEYLSRVELLESDGTRIELEPYHFRPWFLCMGDLSDNAGDETNRAVAEWYGKASVIVKAKE